MDFLQQTIKLLSEPPANVVYHLVMLLALQVTFAIALSRWRRYPDDNQAQRLTWAAGGVFIGRLVLLFVGLLNSSDPQSLATILPPLEQAINTMTAALIVWSLMPLNHQAMRVFDIALVVTLVLCGVLYLFFAQDWQSQVFNGVTYYNSTLQAAIWNILQIIILATGLVYLMIRVEGQYPLPFITIVILLISTVLHLFNLNEIIPADTNAPYFVRLGYLIAFPLWAVYAYQYNLTPLLATQTEHQAAVLRYSRGLEDAAQVIATRQLQRRIVTCIEMAANLLEAEFVAIGLIDNQTPFQMRFNSNLVDESTDQTRTLTIDLNQITAFNLALTQGNTTELLAEGLGARQLHDFYQAVGIEPKGPLLIHALAADGQTLGLLIAGASAHERLWPEDKRKLFPGLASYQAQAILNSQMSVVPVAIPPAPELRETSSTVPSAILLDQVHLHTLQAENNNLRAALDNAKLENKQAVARALAAQKQARYLAAALRAAQPSTSETRQNVDQANVDTVVSGPNNHAPPLPDTHET